MKRCLDQKKKKNKHAPGHRKIPVTSESVSHPFSEPVSINGET